jgi:hypothetical protein
MRLSQLISPKLSWMPDKRKWLKKRKNRSYFIKYKSWASPSSCFISKFANIDLSNYWNMINLQNKNEKE